MSVQVISQEERDLARIVAVIIQLCQGRNNAVGSVTLATNNVSTTVTATNCAPGSTPLLTPTTANAASAVATTYVSSVAAGLFYLTHASNAQSNRAFLYSVIG